MKQNEYIKTDLAAESEHLGSSTTTVKEYSELGFRVSDAVFEDSENHSSIGNGRYMTLYVGSPWFFDQRKKHLAVEAVSSLLKRLIKTEFWDSYRTC